MTTFCPGPLEREHILAPPLKREVKRDLMFLEITKESALLILR